MAWQSTPPPANAPEQKRARSPRERPRLQLRSKGKESNLEPPLAYRIRLSLFNDGGGQTKVRSALLLLFRVQKRKSDEGNSSVAGESPAIALLAQQKEISIQA